MLLRHFIDFKKRRDPAVFIYYLILFVSVYFIYLPTDIPGVAETHDFNIKYT